MPVRPESHATTLHDEPFPELLGYPCQVVISSDGQWVAGSSVMHRYSRVAVYRAADLSCAHLLTFSMEAETIAFHPALPLLAIGLDNGDEYDREGGLTLLECGTGHRVDFTGPAWGIDPVRWLDDHTLELVFFAVVNGVDHLWARATVVRENWLGLTSEALDLTALDRTPLDPENPRVYDDISPAQPLLRTLAEGAGRSYDAQGGVRAVAGLGDGRVLATRKHVAVECWAPDGSALWSVPAPSASGGTRIEVAADERSVRVAVSGPDARARTDFLLVDTADGTVRDRHSVPFSAAMSARTDGIWAIRDTYDRSFGTEPPTPPNTQIFLAGGSDRIGAVHVPDRYDLVPLQVRRCPELLYGRSGRSVVSLAPDGAIGTALFSVDAPLGPAVYACDAAGAALLHGRTELVRRDFPSGEVRWSRPLESGVIDLDSHDGALHVLCADGSLVSLDAIDGTVLHRRPLPPYQPLSLHAAPDGTILVGTTAGQILRCPTIRVQGRTDDR
ncbi:PQQ-binding-like beta-propeller repeat protein [Streptomyces sp. NPDC048438]|uniref:outer membrane protein assembly factor BamB family protein n=1 Tax=Streptomyces sp. NPDC048438 TaxID=3365551 RepID=UPI003719E0B8